MTNLNEELLSEDPNSQAVEVGADVAYEPHPREDSQVIATEPPIISIGRGKRSEALRQMHDQPGGQ